MTSASLPNSVTEHACAKVNLFLRVVGRRDDGYHDLDTVLVPISMADTVRVHAFADPGEFRTLSLSLEVDGPPDLVAGVPTDGSNLAFAAALALAERTGTRGFAEIVVTKRIPAAAGLGGGSADAAAVLRALDRLWGTSLPPSELAEVAATVGSDIPALLTGGAVRATGRGEVTVPSPLPSFRWALVTFGFGVRTPDAFGWWDEDGGAAGSSPDEVLAAATTGDPTILGPLLFNDLEEPVGRRHPEVLEAKARLLAAGATSAIMSGSGPSVVGLLDDETPLPEGAVEVRSGG